MPTTVSLVIPVHNRERYLPTTFNSILAQTYPHFELIVWDDHSTDKSLAIAILSDSPRCWAILFKRSSRSDGMRTERRGLPFAIARDDYK
ncbi:MAG: glycosyltransferase family 2 protein [Leptolyngbyaceae cyanobacterium SL_5_14]|nr:glycosyltransferase family 2 protein [Leptolyngbyaceae cyanobacterium SL_5_14]